ncbi:Choline transporter-like protein [Phaffia rhodozyma]|uniref:Protein PNS1 n=1 Tax=Phaffia rhodozyma TaxID=264483 RepID=A0A0F7SSP5_PHARH|nr:Choline transporter-like protein [Phaffia rhodozyma]
MAPALSLSAYASNFLKNPINTTGPYDKDVDEADADPLFYSTHRPTPLSRTKPLQTLASSSTLSLPHVFNSTDSFAGPDEGSAGEPSRVIFDSRFEEGERSGRDMDHSRGGYNDTNDDDDDDDDGGEYLHRVEREEREQRGLLAQSSKSSLSVNQPLPPPPPPPPQLPTAGPSRKGWLAHQSHHPHNRSRSSSTSSSTSSTISSSTTSSLSDPPIPSEYLDESRNSIHGLPPPRGIVLPRSEEVRGSEVLRERLLPSGDGIRRVERLMALGSEGRGFWEGRGDWRKFRDYPFLALYLLSVTALFVFLPFTLFFRPSTPSPTNPPAVPLPSPLSTPFRTLLHTLPLLSLLLFVSTMIPPLILLAMRRGVRVVLVAVAVGVPLGLAGVGWWAFVGSFEAGEERGWWGGTGLRILSIIPLLFSGLASRLLWTRRAKLSRTVSVVELASDVLLKHPPLLALTPALLVAFTVISIPFITVLLRLFLLGYFEYPAEGTYTYHLQPKADWLIILVIGLWVWTWGVFRGIGRVTISGVVGEWYFHRNDPIALTSQRELDPFGLGFEIETTKIAFQRATGPSLGTICLSALAMTTVRAIRYLAYRTKKFTSPTYLSSLPSFLHPLNILCMPCEILTAWLDQLNSFVLVYVGVTGEGFVTSAKGVAALVGRRSRTGGRKVLDYTLISLLLNLASVSISAFTAAIGYLFALHALNAPGHAPLAGLLCGGAVFLAVRFSLDGLMNASDALFICHAVDAEHGGTHCPEAGEAFGGSKPRRGAEAA